MHPLAKRAKDIGSAAVMLALVNAGVVWLLVLSLNRGSPAGERAGAAATASA